MLSFEPWEQTRAQLCALWGARRGPPAGSKWCFLSPCFTTMAPVLSFIIYLLLSVGGWCGGWVGVLHVTSMAASPRPGRGLVWGFRTIIGFGGADVPHFTKNTRALISAQNNAPNTLSGGFLGGEGDFSTLDVYCSGPLCSIGSYFGEAPVLLSNLLTRLQMKVIGGGLLQKKKEPLWPFWSGQSVWTRQKTSRIVRVEKIQVFCISGILP